MTSYKWAELFLASLKLHGGGSEVVRISLSYFVFPLMLSLMGQHKLRQQYKQAKRLPGALKQGQQRN